MEDPTTEDDSIVKPISAKEFETAIERLREAGWALDERGTLVGNSDSNDAVVDELKDRYPLLPLEVEVLVFGVLTGIQVESEIVGPQSEEKLRAVARLVVNDEIEERFFLRHSSKLPRYSAVDWEVVVKYAERAVRAQPRFPYALITMNTVADVHDSHEHQNITFAIGRNGLRALIAELSELRDNLDRVWHETRNEPDKRGDKDACTENGSA